LVSAAPDRLTPIIFVGGSRLTPIESLIADAQEAAARDLLERLAACADFATPIVATSSLSFARSLAELPGEVVFDDGNFHFGHSLAEIVNRFGVRHALYLGGGSAPLLTENDLALVSRLLARDERCLVANNFFSADFVAFTPASAISEIEPPTIDNDLAYRLQRSAGLRNIALARSASTQMDLDTPTDLLIVALHRDIGRHLRSFLETVELDLERLRAVGRHLTDPTSEVIVSGRVGSHVLAVLETELACRTRVFSEERGMRASGRETRGEVRSLLGYHYSAVGARQFFADLAQLGNAAFIDSRVLFNHLNLTASASDRFNSDLLRPEAIEDPIVREFTEEAAVASIPVVLGGHSLVSGGLWALAEAGWIERDRERGVTSPR
jgi:hypothetical protein